MGGRPPCLEEDIFGCFVGVEERHAGGVAHVAENLANDLKHRRDSRAAAHQPKVLGARSDVHRARGWVIDGELASVRVRDVTQWALESHGVSGLQRVQLSSHHPLIVHLKVEPHSCWSRR